MSEKQKELEYLRAALSQRGQSDEWRKPKWLPAKVRMLTTVRPDMPFLVENPNQTIALIGIEYNVQCNKWGAVSAKTEGVVIPDYLPTQ